MDVIGFLCVSIGSSTMQLHDSLGSRRAYHVQRLVSVAKWRPYLRSFFRRAAFYSTFFCGQKDSIQKTFIKKCFLFTVGSVCRVKRFTTGSRNSLKDVRKSHMIPDLVRKWLRQQSKRLLCCGFRGTGKVEKCFFFQVRISRFTFYYLFVTYILNLPRTMAHLEHF
jgi:hypothetical protein